MPIYYCYSINVMDKRLSSYELLLQLKVKELNTET